MMLMWSFANPSFLFNQNMVLVVIPYVSGTTLAPGIVAPGVVQ